MSSTTASLKDALVVALYVMLLQSSMGQEPAPAPAPIPPSDCPPYCASSICTPMCKARSDDEARKCHDIFSPEVVYNGCFERCSSQCNGNSYARGCCTIDSCSPGSCGNRCARSCCQSCSASASYPLARCMSSQEKVFGYCMPPCMTECNNKCVNGSVPYTP